MLAVYDPSIKDKSAASFCCQVATWVPDIVFNFYFVKNHKIANNSSTKVRENKLRFGILIIFYVCLAKFRSNQILLHKINYRFCVRIKLFKAHLHIQFQRQFLLIKLLHFSKWNYFSFYKNALA